MKKLKMRGWIPALVLAVLAYFFLVPLLHMVFTSFKTMSEASAGGSILPKVWTLDSYRKLFALAADYPIWRWLANTFFVTFASTLLVLVVDVLAAYALARLNMPGRKSILRLIIINMCIPGIVTLFPSFYIFKTMGMTNSFIPLILPYVANVYGVYLIYNFLISFPKELEEAAKIDGAGLMTILLRVVLPSIKPVVMTLGVLTFIGTYNDYLWPFLVTDTAAMKTITVGISSLVKSSLAEDYALLMAATLIAVLPSIIVFLFVNHHLVRSSNQSGLK